MSHIPSAAMPHAKPHEPVAPPKPKPAPIPWLAWAIGGALIAGTALTAVAVLRKPAKRRAARKPAAKRATRAPAKSRRKKSDG